MIDCIPNIQGQVNAYVPPADKVQEIKIEKVNYDARSGRSPGVS